MVDPNRFDRTIYGKEQLIKFFNRIKYPQCLQDQIFASEWTPNYDTLRLLQLYAVSSIPFESLSLHYSKEPSVNIKPEYLFDKIVGNNNGRGGYCMENNGLMGTVFRSIGYRCYPVGARVNSDTNDNPEGWPGPEYFSWSHMINVVILSDAAYFIDIGFGAMGPHHPIPLAKKEQTFTTASPAQVSFSYEPISDAINQDQRYWIYRHRKDSTVRWTIGYSTPALEFLPVDFEMMSKKTSTEPGLFTNNVLCSRLIMEGDVENERLVGHVSLMKDKVKRVLFGEETVVETLKTEEERLVALWKWFGVKLSEEEIAGIMGKPTELECSKDTPLEQRLENIKELKNKINFANSRGSWRDQ